MDFWQGQQKLQRTEDTSVRTPGTPPAKTIFSQNLNLVKFKLVFRFEKKKFNTYRIKLFCHNLIYISFANNNKFAFCKFLRFKHSQGVKIIVICLLFFVSKWPWSDSILGAIFSQSKAWNLYYEFKMKGVYLAFCPKP